ncbi:hypothetical protein CFC21_020014 [Triticum aestivum]|uniref:Uncharacterized protein n=3 Tax=Triticum TaxID=4564 RepID=A0A9R1REX3_TRITD|nr:uncharacterized protein LOC123186553 [Triticum aestivum]KAF7004843.1 hypothetical protein CFC21_020014 [Triticum aestivum]WGU26816.1 hypothetical protein Tm_TraesCS2A03G1279800 [Triticum monococcum]VAH38829.1 unnamed protein product [Triticum turgidum subsp. durum]
MGNELDAFSEELRRRLEVRIINKYAVVTAYVRITLKSIGALLLLWATVVLLGGFVSSMKKDDFWSVTIIAFVQAAGVFEAIGFAGMDLYWETQDFYHNVKSWLQKCWCVLNQLPMRQWWKKQIQKVVSVLIVITLYVRAVLVLGLAVSGPCVCLHASSRATNQDYGIADGEAIKANMKRALNLFYNAVSAHSFISVFWMPAQALANKLIEDIVSRQHGFSRKVIRAYLRKTKDMCLKNKTSATSWNFITYGAGLLDSSLPEEYAAGGRVLTMLIDKDIPSQVRRLLIRSPRQRIQKLIDTLAWRSPADQEMTWLAARIVEHLASDLNLAHFPGALECISSLFNQLPVVSGQGTKNLVLPGLRILENLAHDEDNCRAIYNSKGLLSKIVAPLRSNELVQDIKSSAAWTKVVHGSLTVVTKLMSTCAGATGKEMRGLIADDSHVVGNLEAVIDIKSDSSITSLQVGALTVLIQSAVHNPASTFTERLIKRALHIFISTDWTGDYLNHDKNRMKEAKRTANLLKQNAGGALEILSSHPEAIKSFTVCDDDIHRLTELLDCNIKSTECKISATETVEIEISISCRISAAVILKHLSKYDKEPTLRKALEQLFPIQQDEPIKDRTLQALLLSLVVEICENSNIDLAVILLQQTPSDSLEDFVVSLKKMVEDNMYGPGECLAIHKLSCRMVTELMKHDRNIQVIDKRNIVGTLLEASKAMAELESSMLFSGFNHYDRYGVPLKPLLSVLSKNTEDLLTQKKQALGIYTVPASVPIPLP